MTNIRKHIILPCAILCSVGLLSACAISPAPHQDGANGRTEAMTEDNWNTERQRIIDTLARGDVGVYIQEDGGLLLRLAAAQGFEKDSDEPTLSLLRQLSEVAAALVSVPRTTVQVIGHTDSVGSETYNLQLSIRRAEAVMEYLRQNGIELMRLSADGHGEAEPIADNRKPEGRAENRRVEILLRPFE